MILDDLSLGTSRKLSKRYAADQSRGYRKSIYEEVGYPRVSPWDPELDNFK